MTSPLSVHAIYTELISIAHEMLAHIQAERWEALQPYDEKRRRLFKYLQQHPAPPLIDEAAIQVRKEQITQLMALDAEILAKIQPQHAELRDILRTVSARRQGFGNIGYPQS